MSRTRKRLVDNAVLIATEEVAEIGYLHSSFASVGLPRSKWPGRTFERTSGAASLKVTAGELYDGKQWVQQPMPYGTKPRLAMAYITRYVVQNRTCDVPVGANFTEFLDLLGVRCKTGGENGSRTLFKNQILALAAATMRLGIPDPKNQRVLNIKADPISQFELFLQNSVDGKRKTLWPGVVTISEAYKQSILSHALPVNAKALNALSHSALAMDIYLWLAGRLYRVGAKPYLVRWAALYDQFGKQEYGTLKDFKRNFKKPFEQAKAVYPGAKIEVINGGLLARQSSPPIPFKTAIQVPAAIR